MAVRMAGVEMIDRDPIEPGAEILLHLPHHVAGKAAKVREPVAVLGRDDEPELMAVLLPPLDEGTPIHPLAVWPIEPAALAIPGGSVALQVADMSIALPARRFSRTIRALTTTRRMRWPGPRCSSNASTGRPRPGPGRSGEHLPFLAVHTPTSAVAAAFAGVSGPPFAFAAAFMT